MDKQFYDDDFELIRDSLKEMADLIDNGTTEITIETPEGWKCERPNCPIDYLHKHGTYPSLNPKEVK